MFKSAEDPAEAKEVVVYVFVTTHGDGKFQRGYYEMFTGRNEKCYQGGTKFTRFYERGYWARVMAVNPANLWFPVGDGKLKLIHANDRKRSITEKREDDNEWSGVFIIGVFKDQVIFRSNIPRKQSPKGALLAIHSLCIN